MIKSAIQKYLHPLNCFTFCNLMVYCILLGIYLRDKHIGLLLRRKKIILDLKNVSFRPLDFRLFRQKKSLKDLLFFSQKRRSLPSFGVCICFTSLEIQILHIPFCKIAQTQPNWLCNICEYKLSNTQKFIAGCFNTSFCLI